MVRCHPCLPLQIGQRRALEREAELIKKAGTILGLNSSKSDREDSPAVNKNFLHKMLKGTVGVNRYGTRQTPEVTSAPWTVQVPHRLKAANATHCRMVEEKKYEKWAVHERHRIAEELRDRGAPSHRSRDRSRERDVDSGRRGSSRRDCSRERCRDREVRNPRQESDRDDDARSDELRAKDHAPLEFKSKKRLRDEVGAANSPGTKIATRRVRAGDAENSPPERSDEVPALRPAAGDSGDSDTDGGTVLEIMGVRGGDSKDNPREALPASGSDTDGNAASPRRGGVVCSEEDESSDGEAQTDMEGTTQKSKTDKKDKKDKKERKREKKLKKVPYPINRGRHRGSRYSARS